MHADAGDDNKTAVDNDIGQAIKRLLGDYRRLFCSLTKFYACRQIPKANMPRAMLLAELVESTPFSLARWLTPFIADMQSRRIAPRAPPPTPSLCDTIFQFSRKSFLQQSVNPQLSGFFMIAPRTQLCAAAIP